MLHRSNTPIFIPIRTPISPCSKPSAIRWPSRPTANWPPWRARADGPFINGELLIISAKPRGEILQKQTLAIRTQMKRSAYREHSAPIFMTSSFVFDSAEHARALFVEEVDGDIYTRYSNPNLTELIDKMVQLENAEAGLTFSSGMAAIYAAVAGLLRAGDHIVASRSLFGATYKLLTDILPRWHITTTFVDADQHEQWRAAIQPNTKILFAETPSNPGLDLIDLEYVNSLKENRELVLLVDNCFATPIVQTPIDWGADLVTHSTTKFIDGQGRTIGGILVGRSDLIDEIKIFARQTGPCMSPFDAWLLSKSLETLALRMEKHCANAWELATHFEGHPELVQVKYPFLASHPHVALAKKQMRMGGGLVTFEVKGGRDRAMRFIDAVELASISSNLGDTRTIITHPATTTHSKMTEEERLRVGITPGSIRISVGLEDIADVIQDFDMALQRSK
ncbi:aminotransferase class I/II-fold pyridoxal phosphate-dependent enzyme [candidate division KSB1 bacterium]|nr:aminotransferase class I/II-fold pyridoxal phosphate-dependent enzyme [candidate division KSB1 bacterium]